MTTAVAIGISESLGGVPGITAVVVILTAVVGVTAAPLVFRYFDIRDERAQGLALGITAHALGTARAFQISESAGAFASIGMILNALTTVVLVAVLAQTL